MVLQHKFIFYITVGPWFSCTMNWLDVRWLRTESFMIPMAAALAGLESFALEASTHTHTNPHPHLIHTRTAHPLGLG